MGGDEDNDRKKETPKAFGARNTGRTGNQGVFPVLPTESAANPPAGIVGNPPRPAGV